MSCGAAAYRVLAVLLLGLALAPSRMTAASSGEDVTAWSEIDKLVAEDKLEEALPRVEEILGAARTAGDEEAWARALVQAAWLRASLYKPEDAARFLQKQP